MTSLKALELFGFKSFADRTRFEFPEGVTAVVGPNGSGKSNVVDAIKWVLGEQSARSLRGKEMTDVIFAGSTARKPLNMAEVGLIFDNSARELPLPTDDVQIMRRVYRSGESEYLVNGQTARLKDIRELFSGTGAATEAYSVIEQGRVDALLMASGRDRRAVFEEAAGITRFRSRRAEALRRLERAELNRQRLADIVGEVAARLETVRRQAGRARRWRTLSDRLKTLRLVAASRDLAEVDASILAAEEALAGDRRQLTVAEERAAALSAELTTLEAAAAELSEKLGRCRTTAASASQREAAAAARQESLRARRPELEQELARMADVAARVRRDTKTALAAADAAEAAAAEAVAAVAEIETRLGDTEHLITGSDGDSEAARAALARAVADHDAARQRASKLEAAAESATARSAELMAAVDAARDHVAAAAARRQRLAEAQAAAEGHRESLQARLAAAGRDQETAEASHREATTALQASWRHLADTRAAAEACRERRDLLGDLVGRQDGVSEAARRLLRPESDPLPGLEGMVADQLVIPVEWATLVDLVLGRLGQSLLVHSLQSALAWHQKQLGDHSAAASGRDGGRIGFIAAESLPEPPPFDPGNIPGLVGRLDRLVTPSEEAATAILARRLLGHAWVVDSLEVATQLLTSAPVGTLLLTQAGECLSAAAGLEVGSPAAAAGLVTRRSELRELDHRAAKLAAAVDAAAADVTTREAELARLADEVAAARGRRQQAADAAAAARSEVDRLSRDRVAAGETIAAAQAEVQAAERRAVAAEASSRTAHQHLDEARAAARAAETQWHRRQEAVAAVERSRGEVIEEVHRLRVERVTRLEKVERGRDAAAAARAAATAHHQALATAVAAMDAARSRIRGWELELLAAGSSWAEAVWEADQATRDLANVEKTMADQAAAERTAGRSRDAARDEAIALGERIHAHDLAAGEARHQRARIVERIRDEYDLDIDAMPTADLHPMIAPAASGDDPAPDDAGNDQPFAEDQGEPIPEDRSELEMLIDELRRKLSGMGNVNLEALAEAEELATRLATLEGQLADVSTARESIEQLIARIDEESRRLLGDTIETVRGHFRELFERVFGGGQADLVLEPDVDLLETSVEIVARPPGKEPRNISLLSGGEKTMTCVALLLAIFRSRPSPFCVLDEVDAALDEANVDRFVGVLRDFMSATQFIVVTHSKKTMAAAGTLYGVTMEESGVSKRMSVRFESTAAARASKAA
jgi:chromosome segregation protein